MKLLIILIFLIGFVSAVDFNFDCPSFVSVNEEFECSLSVNSNTVYDVKVEIEQNNKNVAKIWNEESGKWQSAYYYLKNFTDESEETVKLIIQQEGDYNGVVKLRAKSKIENLNFKISAVVEEQDREKEDENEKEDSDEEVISYNTSITKNVSKVQTNFSKTSENSVITLNDVAEIKEREVVYESKSFKVLKYLPYAFCVFLIFVIGILLREKM